MFREVPPPVPSSRADGHGTTTTDRTTITTTTRGNIVAHWFRVSTIPVDDRDDDDDDDDTPDGAARG